MDNRNNIQRFRPTSLPCLAPHCSQAYRAGPSGTHKVQRTESTAASWVSLAWRRGSTKKTVGAALLEGTLVRAPSLLPDSAPGPALAARPAPRRPSPPLPLLHCFASKAPDALSLPRHFHSPHAPQLGVRPRSSRCRPPVPWMPRLSSCWPSC